MRLIWTCNNADQFRTFCSFLHTKGIEFTTEEQVVRDWESDQYGTRKYLLWIKDEDQVDVSVNWLIKYLENPEALEFSPQHASQNQQTAPSPVTQYLEQRLQKPLQPDDPEVRKDFSGHIRLTAFIILVCSMIFLYERYNERRMGPVPPEVSQELMNLSPVRKALLFDYPKSYELLDKIVTLYGVDALAKPQELPAPGRFLFQQFTKEPTFQGFYPYLVAYSEKSLGKPPIKTPPLADITLFEKIRQGQVWRLWTPVLLHVDILHLFFNMVWVLLLGTQIEARLGTGRFFLLMLIAGCLSNIAQYSMTGPNFIGFSGIICAMATYIKARQQVAPWEAYQMSTGTFAFIMFFIATLAFLSFLTFVLEIFQDIRLPIAIANAAHLTGALVGYCLGRMKFFSWQVHD